MFPTGRLGLLLGLGAVMAVGLQSCGGDGSSVVHGQVAGPPRSLSSTSRPVVRARVEDLPADAVARVGGYLITKRTLDHWLAITADLIHYESTPAKPVPEGFVPSPHDNYRKCINYSMAVARDEGRPPGREAALRRLCKARFEGFSSVALERLILMAWIRREAAKAHITLKAREIGVAVRSRFGSTAGLRRFLRFTGLDVSDARLIAGAELLKDRWTLRLPVYGRLRRLKGPETEQMVREVDRELAGLSERLAAKWAPVTHCRAGYVVRGCQEFKG